MLRPELQAGLLRWREVIAALGLALFGLWTAWQGGYLLTPLGLAFLAMGAGWALTSWRRLRFHQPGEAPGILRVTEQTTAGTQRTAEAVGELASLATELKGSVAGFKVA